LDVQPVRARSVIRKTERIIVVGLASFSAGCHAHGAAATEKIEFR
jgi:hypothetical protein